MRKKGLLVAAAIWAVIAVLIAAALIMALTGNRFLANLPGFGNFGGIAFMPGGSTALVREESFPISSLDKIGINTSYHSIAVNLTDDGEMVIRQYDTNSENLFTAGLNGSMLNVEIPKRVMLGIFGFTSPRLEIDLPRGYAGAMTLETASGGISCPALPLWGDTAISSSSGAIRLESGIECAALSISSSSGAISLGNIRSNSAVIGSSSGAIRLSDVEASGDVRISSTSGSIHAGRILAADYSISSRSGAQDFDGISGRGTVISTSGSISCGSFDVRGDSLVESSSGTVRLTLAPDQNFAAMISTVSGSIHEGPIKLMYDRSGRNATGSLGDSSAGTLSIRTSSGDIRIANR